MLNPDKKNSDTGKTRSNFEKTIRLLIVGMFLENSPNFMKFG